MDYLNQWIHVVLHLMIEIVIVFVLHTFGNCYYCCHLVFFLLLGTFWMSFGTSVFFCALSALWHIHSEMAAALQGSTYAPLILLSHSSYKEFREVRMVLSAFIWHSQLPYEQILLRERVTEPRSQNMFHGCEGISIWVSKVLAQHSNHRITRTALLSWKEQNVVLEKHSCVLVWKQTFWILRDNEDKIH